MVKLGVMNTTLESRVAELEKKVAELSAEILRQQPVAKDWRKTVGMLVDDELSREADRLGAEWRAQQREP